MAYRVNLTLLDGTRVLGQKIYDGQTPKVGDLIMAGHARVIEVHPGTVDDVEAEER